MQGDSLYNLIEQLEPMELTRDTIKPQKVISKKVRVSKTTLEILDQAINLASTWKREKKPSVFHEDHLRMLVLAGKLYRNIPDNLQQYLFHHQETITQSRWCTTASGYLRIALFHIFYLNKKQEARLYKIVSFVANVYVPVFVKTNLHPNVPDGPDVVLLTRDLMKDFGVPEPVKEIFLNHAER